MILASYAKINLLLKVTNKRTDGYHDIYSIMQSVSLHDTIEIKKTAVKGIEIDSTSVEISCNESNTVYKAAKLMIDYIGYNGGIKINIDKKIPVEAGLAGGSSNAASVFLGLNKLLEANLPTKKLMDFAIRVGADVPFCLLGGTAVAQGIGEKLTKVQNIKSTYVLLINPDIKISTDSAYKGLKYYDIVKEDEYKSVIEAINNRNKNLLNQLLVNTFEHAIIEKHPQIKQIKEELMRLKAFASLMSGSGSTVFGLFENHNDALLAKNFFKKIYKKTYLTTTNL